MHRPQTISSLFSRLVKDREGNEVEVEYRVEANFTPGAPGKLSGPPEDCYPDEPSEIEYTRVLEVVGKGEKVVDLAAFIESLDKADEESLQEQLALAGIEREEGWADDEGDRKCDELRDRNL